MNSLVKYAKEFNVMKSWVIMILRTAYLNKLKTWQGRDLIKVVTGVRRCGKSTLLMQFANLLQEQGVSSKQIITINLEQLENERLLNYKALHDDILARLQPNSMNYVFIDEVQNVPNFQKAVDSLYTRNNIDLYITGSNALLLEGTLATLLSGRYIEISMLPLSFAEYASALPDGTSTAEAYRTYIMQGAFPAALPFATDSLALHDYLEGIINTVLFKDVAQKVGASNMTALQALVQFLFDNIGNLTSVKSISDALKASGLSLSPNTVADYLEGLVNSYLLYRAKRYDIKGKRLLKLNEKIYAVDMGMRRALLSGQVRDTGRILENVVFLELKRRFGKVYVGNIKDSEIDFVVEGADGVQYFQVAETVANEVTLERELRGLASIKDNNPKTLLTFDEGPAINHNGIIQKCVLHWLLEDPGYVN